MAGYTLSQLQSMGAQSTQSGGLTLSQIRTMQAPQEKQSPSFFGQLIADPLKTLVVKPGVRFGQMLGNVIAPLLGATPEGIDRANRQSRTFAGMEIEPQKAFGEGGARQIIGDTAKAASYLYTGGSVPTIAGQTMRQQILRAGLTSFKTGAIGGGAYAFGDALQQAENQPSDIAYQTLFGTALGGVTGGILGVAIPTAGVVASKLKQFGNVANLETKLYDVNKTIFKPTSTQLVDWERAGVDPIKTFTREFGPESIPTSKNTLQLDDLIAQTDARYKAGSEAFNTILRNSPEVVSLSQREARALQAIEESSLTPTQKANAKARIQDEFVAIKNETQQKGWLQGEDNLRVDIADNYKDRFWGATKYFGPEEASITNEVNRNIGRAFKEGIEEVVTDTNVKEFNKQLQELIYLRDFLESRNGKVPGTGGKMLRYTARIAGAVTGAQGGIFGSVLGTVTADQLAQAIASPSARTWLIRRQLQKLSPQTRKTLEQEALQILERMNLKRQETLRLPAPSGASLVNQGRPIPVLPNDSNKEFVGPGLVATSQRLSNSSQITQPIQSPTNAVAKNAIDSNLTQKGPGSQVFGGFAGLEMDEEGNLDFDPTKAALGIAGTTAAYKISPESVLRKIDGTDLKLIRELINKQDLDSFLKARPVLEGMKILEMKLGTMFRFLQEVVDLSTKKLKVR